jgi:glycosyltransferase involved in cell wall biosynthesis
VKVLLLSRYDRVGASSRVRTLQYIPFLESKNWKIDISPLFSNEYLQALYSGQPRGRYVLAGYWKRIQTLFNVKQYDLVWIEKEVFPFMPALTERLLTISGVPYVVDFDDALFHRYDQHHNSIVRLFLGRKIDVVMKHAELVIAGNKYLANRAISAGANQVKIIPTVVDVSRYDVSMVDKKPPLVVGWVGTPSTSRYLSIIKPIFESLKKKFDVSFVAVGGDSKKLQGMCVDVLPWTEKTEVHSIQSFDIGIMPLEDSPWEHGKCGYKLIQYMACGLPVVASPVGVNKEIVKQGINGFLAQNIAEWEQALFQLLSDPVLRCKMGKEGKDLVKNHYSLEVQAPRLETLFRGMINK